jgi:hypothetical protein
VDTTEVRLRFGDALALYDWKGSDARDLVAASTNLLVLGMNDDELVALASKVVTPLTSPFEMDELIADARDRLNMPTLDESAAAVRVTQAQIRRWERGDLSDSQLTSWAHRAIGHEGPEELQDLVVMDDRLDEYEGSRMRPIAMHSELAEIAALILGIPDPWS